MSRLARLAVALALAFAIPLQAMSAVVAGLCMPTGHHAPAQGHDSDDPHHHADDQQHEGAVSHQHEDGDSQASKAHCPPCAACCAAASISSAAYIFLPEPPTAGPIAAALYAPAGYQPDGFDRPPLAL